MADSIWWTKMLHKDYCAHYCEMSDSEIVADVRRSVASLMMQRSEGSDFGALMVRMAMERIDAKHETAVSNGQQGGRPRKNQDFTADGDIREDSHDGKSGTSANNYGDAATREGADVSTTVSMNMRRVPQNEAPAHGFSGGRTAQGTMSRSPEAAAQSGKDYDQETDHRISTDEAMDLICAGVMASRPAPTRNGSARPPVSRRPASREDFHAFVADNNLHEGLAEEWYAIHEARGWVDENGNPIKNWRGALKNYCIKIEQKRRTA